MALVLKLFAYLFHFILSIGLIGLAIVTGGSQTVNLDMVPGWGWSITTRLYTIGIVGLIALALAIAGKLRVIYLLYAVAVFAAIVWGYFIHSYRFATQEEWWFALYLTGAALLAVFGALARTLQTTRAR